MKTGTLLIVAAAAAAAAALGLYVATRKSGAGGGMSGIVTGAARAAGITYPSASPAFTVVSGNEGMSVADQYAQYGAGRRVAEVYSDMGMGSQGSGIWGYSRDK